MVSDWTDRLEVGRSPHAVFTVRSSKYGEDPDRPAKKRWFDFGKSAGIKSPSALLRAIKEGAEDLGAEIDSSFVVEQLASVDWIAAAVIAKMEGQPIPRIPPVEAILAQRSLRALGKVRLGAVWGYDMHEIAVALEKWLLVLGGGSFSVSKPYWYEGERFTGVWSFRKGHLEVSYDDGATGWTGGVGSLDLIDGPKIEGVDLATVALSPGT